eukprot:10685296-Alexandrium_andersonii.AAC.1
MAPRGGLGRASAWPPGMWRSPSLAGWGMACLGPVARWEPVGSARRIPASRTPSFPRGVHSWLCA